MDFPNSNSDFQNSSIPIQKQTIHAENERKPTPHKLSESPNKIKPSPRKQDYVISGIPQTNQQPEEHITIIFSSFKDSIKNADGQRLKEILQKYQEKYDLTNRLDPVTKQISTFLASTISNDDKCYEILSILFSYNANPHFIDAMKQSALFYLSKEGNAKCVKLLLDKGVSPNQTDIHGQTPIYYASRDGKLDVLKCLVENGADINHKDNISNQTCLFYAARDGRYEACKYILENGGIANHMDNKKQTPLNWARKHNKKDVIELLQSYTNTKHKEIEKKIIEKPIKQKKENPEGEVFIDKVDKPVIQPQIEVENRKIDESIESKKRKREKYEAKIAYKLVYTDENGKSSELTYGEFEKFKEKYPQIAQMMLQADSLINDKMIKENKEKETWEKTAKKILNTIWKTKGAFYFHSPVDPIKLKIEDYFEIVKKPMDFGTIKNKLNTNVYLKPEEFVNDMNLVFSNCILYNGTESDVGKIGINIQKEFEIIMKMNSFGEVKEESTGQNKINMMIENQIESKEEISMNNEGV